MKNTFFRIGEMAAMNHISTQTLRLYDRNKLLEPEYMDPETGYRYYTLQQCAKLDLIRVQKNLRILNSLPPFGKVFFEYVPERKMDVQQTDFDCFAMGCEGYENMLRHMQNYLYENQLPPFLSIYRNNLRNYWIPNRD